MVGYDKRANGHLGHSEILLAGAAAGVVSRFVSQPFDVLKVKFQLQVEPISHKSTESKYRAMGQAVRVILKEEGARALWGGHNPGQLLSITYGAANFTTFECATKVAQEQLNLKRGSQTDFCCGLISGTVAAFVSYPFDVLRTRFIAQGTKHKTHHSYSTMFNGLAKMVRNEGVRALFKGLLPALLQGAPLIGVSFATHGIVKSILDKTDIFSNSANRLNLSGNLIAGGAAGFVSKTVIYPLDVTRRRMQFQGFQSARIGYGQNFTCYGLLDCLRTTMLMEGPRGFFKGYVPSVLKTTLSTAVYFTAYEQICDFFRILHNF